jgi:hypothetical protein
MCTVVEPCQRVPAQRPVLAKRHACPPHGFDRCRIHFLAAYPIHQDVDLDTGPRAFRQRFSEAPADIA